MNEDDDMRGNYEYMKWKYVKNEVYIMNEGKDKIEDNGGMVND